MSIRKHEAFTFPRPTLAGAQRLLKASSMAIPAQLEDMPPEADTADGLAIPVPAPSSVHADADERMLAPVGTPQSISERRRLAVLFGAFFALHVALLVLFFATVGFDDPPLPEREIAVEVVQEPQPQPQPPPPEEQKPPEKQQEAQKPPPPKLDMKPATDAPRAPNKETVDRDAPDEKTQAPQLAKQADPGTAGQPAETPAEEKSTPAPETGPATEKTAIDKPDAEAIERAEAKPEQMERFTSPQPKTQNGSSVPTIAQMMSRLDPVPDYKIAGAAPPAPVSGGTAKPNYLSILYGMVVPKYRAMRPPGKRAMGRIVIYIDTVGNILHMGVLQPSGSAAADNAALAAVRNAAPFPRPPAGLPAVTFTYE